MKKNKKEIKYNVIMIQKMVSSREKEKKIRKIKNKLDIMRWID